MRPRAAFLFFSALMVVCSASSWSSEDLAIYDLVDELACKSFYQLFDIAQDSSLQEIKRAYRRLSMEWHPDRNSAEDATEKFRQIASVYEVLKDKDLREKYDHVLEFGLPDWRHSVYYYRRVRKMGGVEALALLLAIFSGAHYLMLWGAYFERRLVETQRRVKAKKGEKKSQKILEEEEATRIEEALTEYRPTWQRALPILLAKGTLWLSLELFQVLKERAWDKRENENVDDEIEEEEPSQRRRFVPSQPQERHVFEVADIRAVVAERPAELDAMLNGQEQQKAEGEWSGEEMAALVRLSTTKFPPGCAHRWQGVARVMGRTVEDVIAAARKIKHFNPSELAALQSVQPPRGTDVSEDPSAQACRPWTQEEQKTFELALQRFPKGTPERWERIAEQLENRSRAEVVERFKQLAELVKQRKDKTTTA